MILGLVLLVPVIALGVCAGILGAKLLQSREVQNALAYGMLALCALAIGSWAGWALIGALTAIGAAVAFNVVLAVYVYRRVV